MADANKNTERLKEITDSIEQGIKDLFESDKYMKYLRTMSRFHRYSLNNTVLIAMQRPDATLVAGFNRWRDQFGRNVMRGEKGIKIIAPTPFKKKIELEKIDPETRTPMLDKNGKVMTEEVEIKIPMYKVVSVFDASQTEGKPLPQLASNLTGDVQQYDIFMEALRRSSPVPIAFEEMQQNTDGYFSESGQRIAIRSGMSEVQTVSATIHEIAHSKLHNYEKARLVTAQIDETAESPKPKDRRTEEVEAESVSFAVCAYYGIQTGENSFGYIANWSRDKELPELRASLETINRTASGLIDDIDRHFVVIAKERGIDMVTQEKADMTAAELAAAIDEFSYDYDTHGYHDAVDDREIALTALTDSIEHGNASYIEDWLKSIVNENDGNSARARQLLEQYERFTQEQTRDVEQTVPEETGDAVPSEQNALEQSLNAPELSAADDYPMPDPAMSIEARNAYGYTDDDMLPLSSDRAIELYEKDMTIYMLYEENDAGMAFDRGDIENHTGIFGISREEWDANRDDLALAEGDEQQQLERRFLGNTADAYAIFQIRDGDELRDIRFEPMDRLESAGLAVERGNYDIVYTGGLTDTGSTVDRLGALWDRFNNDHPADFRGHSLSVSDIIALKQNGAVSCHYVDSFGFKKLPAFLKTENYLKNAEIAMEDDYCMIDGIINNGKHPSVAELEAQAKAGQPISLTELARAAHAERADKRKSVLEQLTAQPMKPERHKTAPYRGAEMER